jgi:hydroxyethylthiazole kinase
MEVPAFGIWSSIERIRRESPVIHNITNYVVMNSTANALLALGASPVMAMQKRKWRIWSTSRVLL